MKKIKVAVRDINTLVLLEDASKDDIIDLEELKDFDTTALEEAINNGKDQVYLKRLEEYKHNFDIEANAKLEKERNEFQLKLNDLNNKLIEKDTLNKHELNAKLSTQKEEYTNEINKLKLIHSDELSKLVKELEVQKTNEKSNLDLKLSEQKLEYDKTISDLNNKLEVFKSNEKANLELALKTQSQEYEEKITELLHKLDTIKSNEEALIKNKELELQNKYNEIISKKDLEYSNIKQANLLEIERMKNNFTLELEKKTNELNIKHLEELKVKDDEIANLQRQKASLNVKQTGEDLEAWCDNTVREAFQNGFSNCTWKKDNDVIRDDGETKGSKADYIFRCYATEEMKDDEEVASICMDMKDENPDSVNKKTNESYYKQLDKNRLKKHCKYAVLVSNLEMDKPNALPMWKVREYSDMYVVRPAYLMTFLNMITSLSMRYSKLILQKAKEEIDLKDKLDILEDFSQIKNTYLDKPLLSLEKDLADINKNNQIIHDASEKIREASEHITVSYIQKIQDKINNFEIRLNRDIKKIDKLD